MQDRRSQTTHIRGGKIQISKRSGFLNGERGRQAVVYMEEVLIVELDSPSHFIMYK